MILEKQIRIFQIGFNKCGTNSIHEFFKDNGLTSLHWERGYLARNIKYNIESNRGALFGYENYNCFTDMENAAHDIFIYKQYFKELDIQYPNSKFILNIRPLDKWLLSREKHAGGRYINIYMNNWNMTRKDVIEKWEMEWNEHISEVLEYFKTRSEDICIFDIESEPDKFFNFMSSLIEVKSYKFGHYNKTGNE